MNVYTSPPLPYALLVMARTRHWFNDYIIQKSFELNKQYNEICISLILF